ncbi:MAG TPA: hypothetical protein VMY76_04955 [Gemmatimonadales bacterium]|nr:hypothetical protein [Gemmatimonadales bacterium]
MIARRLLLTPILLAALTAAPAGAVGAQTTSAAAWQATPASVLKGALRSAAAAQARYRAEHGTYAPSAEALALRSESGIRVDILGAGITGWQGRATHLSQPGRSCVVFVGSLEGTEAPRTDGDREMAGEEGVPLCDRMR